MTKLIDVFRGQNQLLKLVLGPTP